MFPSENIVFNFLNLLKGGKGEISDMIKLFLKITYIKIYYYKNGVRK